MKRERCSGTGQAASDIRFQNTICPECRAIAPVKRNRDGSYVVDTHTVLVIDFDD